MAVRVLSVRWLRWQRSLAFFDVYLKILIVRSPAPPLWGVVREVAGLFGVSTNWEVSNPQDRTIAIRRRAWRDMPRFLSDGVYGEPKA